jgi:hypothetical protein
MKFCAPLLLIGMAGYAGPTPTYYADILPILQQNCQECHRPGEAAPMAFLTYEQTRPWAKAIKQSVGVKRMPPWFADPSAGKFHNERRLTAEQIATISQWADGGAPAGDPEKAPPAITFVEGWGIGNPDVVFEMPRAVEVPASGTIEYTYMIVPTGFTEDKWIERAEVRPGNRAVTHHVIAFLRPKGSKWFADQEPGVPFIPKKGGGEGGGAELLVGYAPGLQPVLLEPGQAKLLKAGTDIVLQLHYTANGKETSDQSRIGLVFSKEPPTKRVMTMAAMNTKFVIPPEADNYEVRSQITLHHDTELISMMPHMHLRGKAFEYRAVYPTGETEVLLRVPKYNFNWQLWYAWAGEKVLPKGTRIECTALFDNSANNPDNPDPKAEVKWGDQSWEEMMIGWFEVAFDRELDPGKILRAPKSTE